MKNRWRLSGLAMLLMSAFMTAQGQINIVVDAGKPGAKINPNLYGVFFEDINHAGEGGLYGELIRNRDFEATKEPEGTTRAGDYIFSPQGWKHFYVKPKGLEGWRMETVGNASGRISQVVEAPLNKNNPHSMKIEIFNSSQDGIKIINGGFWGIAIREGETYNLSFYAHAANGFGGNVKVALLNEKGEVIDSKIISGIKSSWNKYQCSFIAKAGCNKGSFAVIPQSNGTLWMDVVSLFPEKTFKGRVNGARNDVAQRIADAKPGFVRFPGGCIVEGVTLENRWQWKNTIGDIAQRPGRWMLWDYHSTEGMGFHEYLQFCEDLGCPAMYVFPVGMTCQFRNSKIVDSKALKPYIDDVLDALEYALGPITSKWGALRAKNGHPKPFNIEYLEIGNENYGPVYQDHYNYFYKALKPKYPQLKMIACTDPGMRDAFKRSDLPWITQPIEMIDEHFYESPDFFYKNATRYDQYDRKGPKVYVGEFAVKKWDNTLIGTLDAAIAEAAFLTGLERNADVVELASFAPTLVNVNDRIWNPDLISYDSYRTFGNPTYHVLKLFSNNVPARVLPVTHDYKNDKIEVPETGLGMVGFNNPGAECEYRNVTAVINGRTFSEKELFSPETLLSGKGGVWHVGKTENTELKFSDSVYNYAGKQQWSDYTLTLQAKANRIEDLEGFTVLFYTTGLNKHYKWNIGRWHRYNWLQWYDNGYESYFGQKPGNIVSGKWYTIKIRVKGDDIYCYLDNKLIHSVKAPRKVIPGVYTTAGETDHGEVVLKMVNATDAAQNTQIQLKNVNGIESTGEEMVLTASDRFAENSLENPEKVSVQTNPVSGLGTSFNYKLLPHSVTVLKLKKSK